MYIELNLYVYAYIPSFSSVVSTRSSLNPGRECIDAVLPFKTVKNTKIYYNIILLLLYKT